MIKVNRLFLILGIVAALASCKTGTDTKAPDAEVKFKESWESLSTIEREPAWFKDAKFGIYFHWGVYSVPAYNSEWYPSWMYAPGSKDWGGDVFDCNKKSFGHVCHFNYLYLLPMLPVELFYDSLMADY